MSNETGKVDICADTRSDEALCALARSGKGEAEEELVKRYSGTVRACARPLFLVGGDAEDLIQEGMLGLLQAIREYRADREASFRTFAEVCIRSRLSSALRAASRDKHMPLNRSVSLDHPFFDSNSYTSGALILADPEMLIIDRDDVSCLLESTRKQLSEFEAKILGYYLDGLSVKEIAETMGRSPKSVDNAVQRVRRKAYRQISSGDISKR